MATEMSHLQDETMLSKMIETFKTDFRDELEDSDKYWTMGMRAKDMGLHETADYLLEMSKDEYTHAWFIHRFLKENGVTCSEETMRMYERVESRITNYFR